MELTHEGHERRLGLLLAFGALIWSGTYNALAKGLTPFLSPVTLLILSEALTAMFIVMTFGLVPLLREFVRMDAKSFRICVIYGLFNSAMAPLLWFTGLKYTSAVNASVLSASDIVCVLVLCQFFLGERMTRMQYAGLATIVTGILAINIGTASSSLQIHLGDMFILLGSFFSACGTVIFKKYLSHVMPELAIAIRNIAAIVAVAVFGAVLQLSFAQEVAAFPLEKILLLLAFTFFSRYLDLTFFYEALDRLPATTFSLIQIANPLSGILFAALLLGEHVHAYQIAGCVLILFGLTIEHLSPKSFPGAFRLRSVLEHLRFRKAAQPPERILPLIPKNV